MREGGREGEGGKGEEKEGEGGKGEGRASEGGRRGKRGGGEGGRKGRRVGSMHSTNCMNLVLDRIERESSSRLKCPQSNVVNCCHGNHKAVPYNERESHPHKISSTTCTSDYRTSRI